MCNDNEDRCEHPSAPEVPEVRRRSDESRSEYIRRLQTEPVSELTPLNALRRVERYIGACTGVHEDPDIEEAIARLWKQLVEGR